MSDEHEEGHEGIATCQFCGSEERLTFMMLPSSAGANHMVTACATCADTVAHVKSQLEDTLQYHRDRQRRLDVQSQISALVAVVLVIAGASFEWGAGYGAVSGAGVLSGLAVLRALQ